MLDRPACERRVYRLAVLLTGDPIAATRVITAVVGSQPDLSKLDSAHMDRLTVLRSREISPACLVHDLVAARTAEGLSKLTPQQREAWVMGRIYQTPLREMSRAMDCSTTAAERHLLQADVAMRSALGIEPAVAANQFRKYSMTLEVPEFHRRRERFRRRLRLAGVLVLIAVVAGVLAVVAMWWARPFDGKPAPGLARPATQPDTSPQSAPGS